MPMSTTGMPKLIIHHGQEFLLGDREGLKDLVQARCLGDGGEDGELQRQTSILEASDRGIEEFQQKGQQEAYDKGGEKAQESRQRVSCFAGVVRRYGPSDEHNFR